MKVNFREKNDDIVKEQLQLGIIEEAPDNPEGKRPFHMPNRPVAKKQLQEGAVSTQVRMVFDASAKPSQEEYSINECMNPGLPTQPLMGDS